MRIPPPNLQNPPRRGPETQASSGVPRVSRGLLAINLCRYGSIFHDSRCPPSLMVFFGKHLWVAASVQLQFNRAEFGPGDPLSQPGGRQQISLENHQPQIVSIMFYILIILSST